MPRDSNSFYLRRMYHDCNFRWPVFHTTGDSNLSHLNNGKHNSRFLLENYVRSCPQAMQIIQKRDTAYQLLLNHQVLSDSDEWQLPLS